MNHANVVGRLQETVKMSKNSANSWFAVDIGCKLALFTDCIYFKKGNSVVFSIFFRRTL